MHECGNKSDNSSSLNPTKDQAENSFKMKIEWPGMQTISECSSPLGQILDQQEDPGQSKSSPTASDQHITSLSGRPSSSRLALVWRALQQKQFNASVI
ncbi:hypothetical protein CHS0354_015147 [Potamilus streckersoni]|uniref:Uncharacterized protein n=1 Tax=Potamilus streckersoni TaxID=2493646 RepID=A0AAE0VTK7_9BIVA|nr:hypothetical protein CHS0354_015147 [Potamilus streckersoni]